MTFRARLYSIYPHLDAARHRLGEGPSIRTENPTRAAMFQELSHMDRITQLQNEVEQVCLSERY